MSRGVALSTIRTLLKSEIREAQETNTALDLELNYALANAQEKLCSAHDWTFLKDRWDKAVTGRYTALPTSNIRSISSTINFNRPVVVECQYVNRWNSLIYGIDSEQYNHLDSDAGVTQNPAQHWQLDTNTGDTSNADEFEIWPIPVSSQTVRFTGQRAPRALTSDSEKCDLDHMLLVYAAAMDILTLRESPMAPLAVKKYTDHFIIIRGTQPTKDCPPVIFGQSRSSNNRNVKLIAVAS